jgi:hypothetical protein
MAETADRVTRIAADLMDSAAAEGARQSRGSLRLERWLVAFKPRDGEARV